jgi:transcriptional regulator with GAF, ATPase, and Fis domain
LITGEVEGLEADVEPDGPAHGARARRASSVPDTGSLLRLVELGKRLATEDDPDQVLRMVLHEAIELCGAERGFLVLVRGDDHEFAFAENIDRSEVQQPSFEVSRSLIRRVIEDGKPVLLALPDDGARQNASNSLAAIGARSVACVPIGDAHGKILGVLYLDGRSQSHAFHATADRLLELFASQASAAFENARLHRAQSLALEAAEETIRRHRTDAEQRVRLEGLVGASEPMQAVYRKLDLITATEMPVIVLGETGTGKELAARLIHTRGPRQGKEFVALNCAGLPESLLEGELFGHERGAYTGAEKSRPGLLEIAHRGTLFLDEVGDMSPRMQADLLRALQSGEVRRIGGRQTIHVDVRVIAATHRNLEERIERGEFRQDLYFRLNVLSVTLPPLRERPDDIPLLVSELMGRLATPETPRPRISGQAMRRLQRYNWPGNVRELENVLRRVMVLGVPVIEEKHLPLEVVSRGEAKGRPGTIQKAEDEAILRALRATDGNKLEAARILGVTRKTLYAKLRRLGLHRS